MTTRATSTPNIALIKYWGNRNDGLRLPAGDSLSITLDQPLVEVCVKEAQKFSVRSYHGELERELSDTAKKRIQDHFLAVRKYLQKRAGNIPEAVAVEIRSRVPRGIGLASSAAVFSALAEAYAGFTLEISRKNMSILARLGSGSASRSVYGGYVAMIAGEGDREDSSYALQIAPKDHWKLWDVVIVPSQNEKSTGSTEGHSLAHTSPLFAARMQEVPRRQKECIEAILKKDFEKLQAVSEEDCLDMHAVMISSTPSLNYLSPETHRIVEEIQVLRSEKGLAVLYTMDAGPTVHLICDEAALPSVREYANAQSGCTVFEAGVGGGSHLI